MKAHRAKKYIPIIVVFLISCIIWYSPNYFEKNTFYNGVDSVFPFSPKDYFKVTAYAWHSQDIFGYPLVVSNTFPVAFIVYLLSYLNMPLWILNRLWFFLPTLLFGLSMCYLYSGIFRDRYSYIGCTVAASYIMLIPLQFVPLWHIGIIGCLLIFGSLFRMAYSDDIKSIKGAVIIGIGVSSTLIVVRFTAIILLFIILLGIIFLILRGFKKMAKQRNVFILVILIVILINAYWLVPFIGSMNMYKAQELMSTEEHYQQHINYIRGYHQMRVGSPLWVFKLLGHRGNAMSAYFTNPFIQALTLLFPIYAFTPLLLLGKGINKLRKEKLIIISCMAIFALFLSTIAYFRLTVELYSFIVNRIGLPFALIDPGYTLVFYAFFMAVLVGVSTETWWQHFSDYSKLRHKYNIKAKLFGVTAVMFLILFVHGKAFVYPKIIRLNTFSHIPHAKIPDEYRNLTNYLKARIKTGETMLSLPWAKQSYVVYKWWPYLHLPDLVNRLSYVPTVGDNMGNMELFPNIIGLNDNPQIEKNLSRIRDELKRAGIRYIVIHHDYIEEGPMAYGMNADEITELFIKETKRERDFRLVDENDYFHVFEYLDTYPVIYTANTSTFEIAQEKKNEGYFLRPDKKCPKIEYNEINPAKYLIQVKDAKEPFYLVFSKSFHAQWRFYKATYGNYQEAINTAPSHINFNFWDIAFLSKAPIKVPHMIVNGYANGWYIDPNRLNLGKDFTLVLYFLPQSFLGLGIGITALSLLCCIGCLFVPKNKK